MKLSKESEYGLTGLVYLARQRPGTILQVKEVAKAQDLPLYFLAKTFLKLTKRGVLRSFRGKERGYTLARSPAEISVKEIVEAIEGSDVFQRCVFWSNRCSDDRPCLLHGIWKNVRPQLVALMERITLEDLVQGKVSDLSELLSSTPGRVEGKTQKTAGRP
ncbi:MAG: Rrf2 family transcriptional regulator [Armatimonadota bacterium]|nr:Rrf2 family transcriptional regulator [Armatimonadota bacterium]MDR5703489.1 Rrf2 family transcriptional regulator [Armatimonadota bacterium]